MICARAPARGSSASPRPGSARAPALPGAAVPGPAGAKPVYRRAEVEVSWPISNMGPSLPNLLATVAGNLFELRQFSALRLLDLALPAAFAGAYLGPQFGIAGTRALSGVPDGPLIGTIIKPSVKSIFRLSVQKIVFTQPGSLTDISRSGFYVRFTPNNGHKTAKNGHR